MHSQADAKAELSYSKKHNELFGASSKKQWKQEHEDDDIAVTQVTWEAPYPEMRGEHAYTGVLQRFHTPMGGRNQNLRCIWSEQVHPAL